AGCEYRYAFARHTCASEARAQATSQAPAAPQNRSCGLGGCAMSTKPSLYDQDLYAWTQEQAARLRAGAWHKLDLEHLIEEIEDLGHSNRDALPSHLVILLTHLLKLAIAARHLPHDLTRAGRGWQGTCRTQRLQIAKRLRRNPSLRTVVPEE